jgi:serine/threonine protein phosphatase PrpC
MCRRGHAYQTHDAVCALPFDGHAALDPPASTFVAAWLHADGITLGWLGDSRAYLLAAGGQQLTRDHSWMAMVLERSEMTEADARGPGDMTMSGNLSR